MHLNDLLGNYKRKRKAKRKENHWYRLDTLADYLGKKKWGIARESNCGRGAQITSRYHLDTEEFHSNLVKVDRKVNFKRPKIPVPEVHPVP